ncbi:hypothetical protein L2E82_09170 [Cichorium intybus]|uniref:Uncharacterized protein n=2 Tax=Cichorium intybus TaxID=13427 RepID=A0ACB9G899_CICIN|nr:hypothetical protein L2E82_09167 [Cichorium intybus]KAI3779451.1 hypothetical protein L2E82_09170 [Cichorium intybus]
MSFMVIESASTFGTGSSSRNSEVIHDVIYYPLNSLKVYLPPSFNYFLLQSRNLTTLSLVVMGIQAVHCAGFRVLGGAVHGRREAAWSDHQKPDLIRGK